MIKTQILALLTLIVLGFCGCTSTPEDATLPPLPKQCEKLNLSEQQDLKIRAWLYANGRPKTKADRQAFTKFVGGVLNPEQKKMAKRFEEEHAHRN